MIQGRSSLRVILASASPRRRELLGRLGVEFDVVPSEIDEILDGAPSPETVAALALAKARAVAARVTDGVVLGADTVVVIDGIALGKPVDADDARAMLRRLRGRGQLQVDGRVECDLPRVDLEDLLAKNANGLIIGAATTDSTSVTAIRR